MGSTTPNGYPFPVGTDLVMDGDNAMQALAEAVDGTCLTTRALTTGHSLTGAANTPVSWNAPLINECALTKTSASKWTVTLPGLYVVTAQALTTGFQPVAQRSYMQLTFTRGSTPLTCRQSFAGENTTACTLSAALRAGDTIEFSAQPSASTNIAALTGSFNCHRLGRKV